MAEAPLPYIRDSMLRHTTPIFIFFFLTASICNPSDLEELFSKANGLLIKEDFRAALENFELVLKQSEEKQDTKTTADAL